MEKDSGHSEDYFGDYRNFWWNNDFLELMARRLRLDECSSLLDVGCGLCHWSRLLLPFLQQPSEITAVDSDPKWAAGSDELQQYFEERNASVEFRTADATLLPFEDGSFDFVTCQTVLIHLKEPNIALAEMYRVVKPGGLVLCVEPNNIHGHLLKSSVSAQNSIAQTLKNIEFAMLIERGKVKLGEGDNSYGDLLPGDLAETGFEDVRVFISDKAMPLYPPYDSEEQTAVLKGIRDWNENEAGSHDWAEMRRFLKGFGGDAVDRFEEIIQHWKTKSEQMLKAVEAGTYHSAGGSIMFLVSGRKPNT